MKYSVNRITGLLLVDENDYTPYLQDRGYEEITKAEYDALEQEMIERMEEENAINEISE